ncbi:arsenate reductase (azurin) large subunit [Arcobacter sp.]|uniref:arsenate reductase (azurin) large subunit n=1 Tax=Arcobacter sp. TaxID=1872629 RepID=UPI003D11C63A
MGLNLTDRLPIPVANAEVKNVTCEFCIVGCGYKSYKWPLGKEGTYKNNAFGIDLSKQQETYGQWCSERMFNTITDRDGKKYNLMVVPDQNCVVNVGQNSVRGGMMGVSTFNASSPTKDRLKEPQIYRGGMLIDSSWKETSSLIAKVYKKIIDNDGADEISHKTFDHGGGGGGFENTWGTGKLFHTAIGTKSASIHNRPAYNSEVHSTREMGIGELNSSYYDTSISDTMLIIGCNPYECQTNLFNMHIQPNLEGGTIANKQKEYDKGETAQSGKIIFVDPRITASTTIARKIAGEDNVLHLQIKPGTDITLMNALVTYIHEKGWDAKEFMAKHTENFNEMYNVNKTSLKDASKITGINVEDMKKAASWLAEPKKSGHRPRNAIYYEKGIIWGIKNYENVASIVNLAILTHSVGRVGTGVCRAGGHQEGYTRPHYHGPSRQNLAVIDTDIIEGKYLVYSVWGTNPFGQSIATERLRNAVTKRSQIVKDAINGYHGNNLDELADIIYKACKKGGLFVVDIDIYPTQVAERAHIVLPAATTMEMNLTSMSGERRMRLSQKVMDAPGSAKPDCLIAAEIANALKAEYKKDGNQKMAKRFEGFDWNSEEDAFNDGFAGQGSQMASQGGPTGKLANYKNLEVAGNDGVQLPIQKVKNGKLIGTRLHYTDGNFGTKSGRAIFLPTAQPDMPKQVATQVKKYKYWVNTGRINEVWQSNYHTGRLEFTVKRWPMAPLEINPKDAKDLGVTSGDIVQLNNDYGTTRAIAVVTDSVREGEVFGAFGFQNSVINDLCTDYVDPDTKIPFYKGTAANIVRIGRSEGLIKDMTFQERI